MNYKVEIINIIQGVEDIYVLAFLYGLVDEIVKHIEQMEDQELALPS